jgi:hypothetical protein
VITSLTESAHQAPVSRHPIVSLETCHVVRLSSARPLDPARKTPAVHASLSFFTCQRAGGPRPSEHHTRRAGEAFSAGAGVGRGVDESDIDPHLTPVNSNRKVFSRSPSHPAPHPSRREDASPRSRKRRRRRGRRSGTRWSIPRSARLLPEEPAGRIEHCRPPPRGLVEGPEHDCRPLREDPVGAAPARAGEIDAHGLEGPGVGVGSHKRSAAHCKRNRRDSHPTS